jgi:hypothetical protein
MKALLLAAAAYWLLKMKDSTGGATGATVCLSPTGDPYVVPVGPCPEYTHAGAIWCMDPNGLAYQTTFPNTCNPLNPGIPNYIPTGLGRITWGGDGSWGSAGRI